ncbi:hypothetical protein TNIN_456361 [Trichonephila inaurata madagascariensis]|uniref:Uncharacterized protein n=1 Tax=Trichonephila inaurata madagascariensis TaxID=2747483 RepID=A0A8X6X6H2_9ARAC|nr:hypothetical protein TNIN_456361 [Trichonephila inaurata madagascariensis]
MMNKFFLCGQQIAKSVQYKLPLPPAWFLYLLINEFDGSTTPTKRNGFILLIKKRRIAFNPPTANDLHAKPPSLLSSPTLYNFLFALTRRLWAIVIKLLGKKWRKQTH